MIKCIEQFESIGMLDNLSTLIQRQTFSISIELIEKTSLTSNFCPALLYSIQVIVALNDPKTSHARLTTVPVADLAKCLNRRNNSRPNDNRTKDYFGRRPINRVPYLILLYSFVLWVL